MRATKTLNYKGAPRVMYLCDRHGENAMTKLLNLGITAVMARTSRREPCATCAVEDALNRSRLEKDAMAPRDVHPIFVPISDTAESTAVERRTTDLGQISPDHGLLLLRRPDLGRDVVYLKAYDITSRDDRRAPSIMSEWTEFPNAARLANAAHTLLQTVHFTGKGLLLTLAHF